MASPLCLLYLSPKLDLLQQENRTERRTPDSSERHDCPSLFKVLSPKSWQRKEESRLSSQEDCLPLLLPSVLWRRRSHKLGHVSVSRPKNRGPDILGIVTLYSVIQIHECTLALMPWISARLKEGARIGWDTVTSARVVSPNYTKKQIHSSTLWNLKIQAIHMEAKQSTVQIALEKFCITTYFSKNLDIVT